MGRRFLGSAPGQSEVDLRTTCTVDQRPGRPRRRPLLVDQTTPKVHALYQSWGWTTLGDLRPRLPDAPIFHAMLLDLPLEAGGAGR
ncbi:hypothetical protein [Streptomyces sp. McG3]|uniref:hypothetical protein n=1 Tax=Streptomyces sp. McG3 TaxID=2725483 RepID=UPI001BE507BD|nr:hypothetical protein [Streptomyces sp. McG3]